LTGEIEQEKRHTRNQIVLVRVLEREVFAHLDRKVMPMDILSLLGLGPNGGLALRQIEVGTANVIVSRPVFSDSL
jgi:hypothetical protein